MKPQYRFTLSRDYTKWKEEIDAHWNILKEQDRQAAANGTLIGRYITHPFADGQAVYVIKRTTTKTAQMEVVSGLGDDWVLPAWGVRPIIPLRQAKDFIRRREKLASLFSKPLQP
jgi:hypothetical protein